MKYIISISFLFALSFCQEETFTIHGKAAFAHGVLIPDAKVMLLDTTQKLIQKTKTSKKFLKKYGGGKFEFSNVPPGEYILSISFETRLNLKTRITLKNINLDLGVIYNKIPFPKYDITEYPVSDMKYMRPIPTEPIPEDTINIRHILVELNGQANTVIVDSITQDSVYYTQVKDLAQKSIDLYKVYLIYNHFGKPIFQSRSLKNRMSDLQKRDGYILLHSGDSVQYNMIYFGEGRIGPEAATFQLNDDTTMKAVYYSLYDIYKIKSGPSYLGNSVRKGFITGSIGIGSVIALQMYQAKSFTPLSYYTPDFSPIRRETGQYFYPAITTLSLCAIGWIAYDLYKDKRTNYMVPKYEKKPFPRNMFVFSLSEWMWKNSQPVIRPIMNSKPVKWWTNRKLRKIKKQATKRKSVSG